MCFYLKKGVSNSDLMVQIGQFTKLVGSSRVFDENIYIFTTQWLNQND